MVIKYISLAIITRTRPRREGRGGGGGGGGVDSRIQTHVTSICRLTARIASGRSVGREGCSVLLNAFIFRANNIFPSPPLIETKR